MKDGSTGHRMATTLFGIFLVAMAILTLLVADRSTRLGSIAVAAVLAVLGVDAVVSAARNTRSLVSRIGPLP
jgi:uncharacterized membrane protein YqjE